MVVVDTWRTSFLCFLAEGKLVSSSGHVFGFDDYIQALEKNGIEVQLRYFDDFTEVSTIGARYRWQGDSLMTLSRRFNFLSITDGQTIKASKRGIEIGYSWLRGVSEVNIRQMERLFRNNGISYWRLEEEDESPSDMNTGLETRGVPGCRITYDANGDIDTFYFSKHGLADLKMHFFRYLEP